MSYKVTFKAKHSQPWFRHALAQVNDDLHAWNETYDSVITLDEKLGYNPDYEWTITFPTEQDYTWFVLRWS